MQAQDIQSEIPGAQDLISWFGSWPSFHDAEIFSLQLNRSAVSRLLLYTSRNTGAIDSRGFYVHDQHTIVTFLFGDVTDCTLDGFNHQNVVSGVSIAKVVKSNHTAYEVMLDSTFGLGGTIRARSLRIEFRPGKPGDTTGAQEWSSRPTGRVEG